MGNGTPVEAIAANVWALGETPVKATVEFCLEGVLEREALWLAAVEAIGKSPPVQREALETVGPSLGFPVPVLPEASSSSGCALWSDLVAAEKGTLILLNDKWFGEN